MKLLVFLLKAKLATKKKNMFLAITAIYAPIDSKLEKSKATI